MQQENASTKYLECFDDHTHDEYESANKQLDEDQMKGLNLTEYDFQMINLNSASLVSKAKSII